MSVEELEERYRQLRSRYPKLPAELRPFQIDVIRALLDPSHQQHVLLAVPTGGGKTLPQLVVPLLSPEGTTTVIIAPLTAILNQMAKECQQLGISYVDITQVKSKEVARLLEARPSILLSSVEKLEKVKVRDSLMAASLSVTPHRIVVCVDEAQVCDPIYGWSDFRSLYGSDTWRWLKAALGPRFLLLIGSVSEDSIHRICGALGIQRNDVLTYTARSYRSNIFLHTRMCEKISVRTRDRDLGFLLPIVASGQSIQIFVMKLTLMDMAAAWLARRCDELGLEAIIMKVSGGSSRGHKTWVMEQLNTRSNSVLFSTDVCAMGTHCPTLNIGVSLGVPSSRWKHLQQVGRVGRDATEHAVFITVFETKRLNRVAEDQRFERNMARAVHSHEEGCRREKLFGHFKLVNPTVVYEDQDLELLRGLCKKCICCSGCASQCQECGNSGELEAQLSRIMGIKGTEVDRAKQYAEQCGEEEKAVFDEDNSDVEEDSADEEVNSEEEEEGEEDED